MTGDVAAPRRVPGPSHSGLLRWSLAAALASAWLLAPPAASGQLPIRPPDADATARPAAESVAQRRSRLAGQLEKARAQRERLAADLPPPEAPPGLTLEDLSAARSALAHLVLTLELQLSTLDEQHAAHETRLAEEKSQREWTGFAGPPPYSMLVVDDLYELADSIRVKLGALAAQRVLAVREAERLLGEAQRSDAALRLAREAATVDRSGDLPRRRWRVQVAEWASEAAAADAALAQLGVELIDEQAGAEREKLTLTERKLAIASRDARLSAEDLAQVRRAEEDRKKRIRAARTRLAEERGRLERELTAAGDALRRLEAGDAAPPADVAIARARQKATQAALDSARFEVEILDSLNIVIGVAEELYTLRQQALTDGDAERRREAALRLRDVGARLRPWRDYAQSQLDLLRATERESILLADTKDVPAQVLAYERAATDAVRQRVAGAQRLLNAASRADRTVSRWLAEIDEARSGRPLADRLDDAWVAGRDLARRIWNFELFAIEDTIEVGGQKITTSHGVTIGKSVGALLLFVIGYWAAKWLARRFERLLIARFAVEPAQARTVRRWTLALFAFVLVVLTLNLARIPLTVFAFLGGALAIGVGFGTQTIIRNFISGLIVLMERQVRVGDTIEVDGVTGTVAEVNLRSSTVRGFDGVEAIIPNSNLLENKVTNWTHTDNRVRRVVRVGVAYGSPVREVAGLLLDCLRSHGLVLKDPEPQVLFEDFADSALVFGMYFWLEMKPSTSSTVVMSDLRFMVQRRFEDAGIAMPFPQRDLHLDSAQPLKVELTGGRQPAG